MDEIERQRDFYGRTAAAYHDHHVGAGQDLEHDRALAALSGFVRAYAFTSVLDVGCGTGRALLSLGEADPSLRLMGVEPVVELREDAIRRGIDAHRIIEGDATSLRFGDDEFDCVSAFGVMHHLPEPERAIGEMFRVARRAVFISDLNNYGCGSTAQRVVSHTLRTLRLWRSFQYLKNGRKHWKYDEDGDGLFYSYSLFDSLPFIRSKADSTYLLTTNDTGVVRSGTPRTSPCWR